MQKKVQRYIQTHHMITGNDTIIVGVSGGADSVCLTHLLAEFRQTYGYLIIAVHVNHGIRGEAADADERYVVRLCKKLSIPCEVYHIDIPALARKSRLSEEEAGREARRRAFEEVMQKYNGTKIALAHHQEDNAETFFLHLARWSRLKGLGGIYPVNGVYIRPLLCVSRKEIEEYLEEKNISYCMDSSNLDDTYTRNRIRNHILPYFKKYINPKTVEHINGAMEQLRQIQEYLDEQARAAYCECVREEENDILILEKEFYGQKELIQGMILRRALVRFSKKEKDLDEIHVNSLRLLMENQSGRSVNLPYKMRAVRTYEGIELRNANLSEKNNLVSEEEMEKELILSLNPGEECSFCYGKWSISCRIFQNPGNESQIPKKTYTKWFDYDIIKQNVSVRTRRSGDRIVIDEKGGSQKLKAYFVNEKIPAPKRAGILLIAEGSQILWIVGYRQSKAYQVTRQTTNILEISINGGIWNGGEN